MFKDSCHCPAVWSLLVAAVVTSFSYDEYFNNKCVFIRQKATASKIYFLLLSLAAINTCLNQLIINIIMDQFVA